MRRLCWNNRLGRHVHTRVGMIVVLIFIGASCQNDASDGPSDATGTAVDAAASDARQVAPSAAVTGIAASIPAAATPGAKDAETAKRPRTAKAKKGEPLGGGCDMCHVDVEDELVESVHYTEGIGCVKCHGPSEGHSADENNDVKADQIYANEEIDTFCGSCHECSRPKVAASAATPAAERKLCTGCHDAHSLSPSL